MSVYPIVSCDGAWGGGRFPCESFLPLPRAVPPNFWPLAPTVARDAAWEQGWTRTPTGGDLCPAHTRHSQAAQVIALLQQAPPDIQANILRDLGQTPDA